MKSLCLALSLALVACATSRVPVRPKEFTSKACEENFYSASSQKSDGQLDQLTELFTKSCFQEVISLGEHLRKFHRDKIYHFTSEAMEIVTPEGTFTEYVMESYERGYLTILISLAYVHLQQEDKALVELRRGSQEQKAEIYNHGEDPILNLMMAALWDRFDPSMSRPYWKFLSEFGTPGNNLAGFATARLKAIDESPGQKIFWTMDGFGYLPELSWQSDFLSQQKGPYKITAASHFPEICASEKSLLVPTSVWVDKIALKYKSDYHPFLYAKSLARVPFGLGYGLLGATTGVAIGVGGCGLASYLHSDDLCKASAEAAVAVIKESGNLVQYT
ncbi:MAG: hypothetical protein ACXWC9_09825, partial [Pseudobdellovibrionaceae bacterium]